MTCESGLLESVITSWLLRRTDFFSPTSYPLRGLTGYYLLRGKCYTPPSAGMGETGARRAGSMSVIAFHEKAGRSQGDSFWYLCVTLFLPRRVATVATLPSALFDERF
jgi:hypothetical protein